MKKAKVFGLMAVLAMSAGFCGVVSADSGEAAQLFEETEQPAQRIVRRGDDKKKVERRGDDLKREKARMCRRGRVYVSSGGGLAYRVRVTDAGIANLKVVLVTGRPPSLDGEWQYVNDPAQADFSVVFVSAAEDFSIAFVSGGGGPTDF